MKIKYEYVNETVEIEVDEKWAVVLQELDRQEYNNEHAETRRHVSHSYGDDGEWLIDDEDPEETIIEMMSCINDIKRIRSVLNDNQNELINALFVKGLSQEEYADKNGVTQVAIARQLKRIREKIKKLF